MKSLAIAVLSLALISTSAAKAADPASPATIAAQASLRASLPFADQQDFEFADRGFLGSRVEPRIMRADGVVAWDLSVYDFLKGPAPDTVNPSLWRQAGLLAKHGLFQVSDHIWQVRGFDVSNITFIAGDTGWIIIDPLTTAEVAKAALELANQKLGKRRVVAVIYTHSHTDHFGGVRGVVDQADVDARRVAIIAPEGFLKEAVSENVIAGPAMNRRAEFQFGYRLVPGPLGQVSSGIGQGISKGTVTLIAPTLSITHTGQTMTIDGVALEFQMTPGTEAPAEMNVYFPGWRILCMAENANVSMHNVLTPRGALVRDAKAWADDLSDSIRLYGPRTDTMFTSHGWPRFGQAVITRFLSDHRDAYKYLHDQSVRMMNSGLIGSEIAGQIALPPVLAKDWFNRGYYGTMSFNSRAVYQRYMGWYDANPAHLSVLAPPEEGRRYVAAMGGAAKVMTLARASSQAGDYGWAASLLNHVVMADAKDQSARQQLAGVYDQLGYQAESAIWRNMYLTAAGELRGAAMAPRNASGSPDLVANLPSPMIFDLLAVRLDPAKAADQTLSVIFEFPDRGERFLVHVAHGVLTAEPTDAAAKSDATLTLARPLLLGSLLAGQALGPKIASGEVKISGDTTALARLVSWFTPPRPDFPVVTR